jgi:hypothetical protein
MNLVVKITAIAIAALAVAFLGAGCGGSPYGGAVPINDFPRRSLTVKHDSSELIVTLAYDDSSRCDLLADDAFARLNGRSVPLFVGQIMIIPPMGDDGGVVCVPPSVTLDGIPPDLSPPWTIEIGDASETVSATFGPAPVTPVVVGPVNNPVLTSSQDTLTVLLERAPGDTAPSSAVAHLTASDKQFTTRTALVEPSDLVFATAVNPGWPPGPVTVTVGIDYFAADVLLGCQAAQCSVAPLSGTYNPPAWTTFTIDLVCTPSARGVCG